MNVAGIKRRAQGTMGDTWGVLVSSALWYDWINDAQLDIARKTECLEDTDVIAVSVGDNAYPKPDDMIRLQTVEFDGSELDLTTKDAVSNIDPARTANETSGTPRLAYVWGGSVYLYPEPTAAGTMTLYYVRTPVEVDSDDDTPEIPVSMHSHIVDYCIAQAKKLDDDGEEARQLLADYELSVSQAQDEAQNPNADSYPAVRLLYGDD